MREVVIVSAVRTAIGRAPRGALKDTGPEYIASEIAHADYYLDEFVFRFNRRTSTSHGKLFMSPLYNRQFLLILFIVKVSFRSI